MACGLQIAAALLESLAARGSIGIFATHLHGLLDLKLDTADNVGWSACWSDGLAAILAAVDPVEA